MEIKMKLIEYKNDIFMAPKEGRREFFTPEGIREHKYLVMVVKNLSAHLQGLQVGFWRKSSQEVDLEVTFGLLPQLETTLIFPLVHLNSQTMFLPRTPGKLKTVIFGNKIEPEEVDKISLGLDKNYKEQSVEISSIAFINEHIEVSIPEVKLVDILGQNNLYDWEGKTQSEKELREYLSEELENNKEANFPPQWSKYGGDAELKYEATGYFRTEFDEQLNRWLLVDPLGYGFYSNGLDCVGIESDCKVDGIEKLFEELKVTGIFKEASKELSMPQGKYYNFSVANMMRAFQENWWERWAELTKNRLINWRFNTIGNWSDKKFCKIANLPYVYPLEHFPTTKTLIYRDFPDVFSREYEDNAKIFATQLEQFKEDPYLIGYFLRNEPLWAFVEGMSLAEELLETKVKTDTRIQCIEFLKKQYIKIEELNQSWNTKFDSWSNFDEPIKKARQFSTQAKLDMDEFSRQMIERYVTLPSIACKQKDPNHLNLGMRYAYIWHKALLAGCEHFDVFSFNCYKMDPTEQIIEIGKMTNLPVMIGEFHFGAIDKGLMSTGLKGVLSQKDRGIAYRFYVENAAVDKYCVGTHYFTLNDQAYLGRFDGENFQIGIVDCCHKVYEDFLKEVKNTNENIYDVIKNITNPTKEKAEEIPRIGF